MFLGMEQSQSKHQVANLAARSLPQFLVQEACSAIQRVAWSGFKIAASPTSSNSVLRSLSSVSAGDLLARVENGA